MMPSFPWIFSKLVERFVMFLIIFQVVRPWGEAEVVKSEKEEYKEVVAFFLSCLRVGRIGTSK